AHPGDGDLRLVERVGGGDGPVAAEGDDSTAPGEASDRIEPAGAFGLEERQRELHHVVVGVGPERLEVRHHAQGTEARDVGRVEDLEVRDVVPAVARAVGAARRLDGVQAGADGGVADGVEVDVE